LKKKDKETFRKTVIIRQFFCFFDFFFILDVPSSFLLW
jgi:hypothetical protein